MVQELRPERCPCGHDVCPDHAVPHPSGAGAATDRAGGDPLGIASRVVSGLWTLEQSQVPAEHATGYGPRLSALMSELAGAYGNGRRLVQTFCASVLQIPISLGAIQKVLDRVAQAIEPHYSAIATQARHAPVNYIDETPWFCTSTLQWLWVMASDAAAFYMIHPHRSKEAFAALIDDWAGILVSDGYGVYRHWVQARQTCLAHLIRSARGLAARSIPIWWPVGHGRSPSCSVSVIWRRPPRVGSGGPGTPGCAV